MRLLVWASVGASVGALAPPPRRAGPRACRPAAAAAAEAAAAAPDREAGEYEAAALEAAADAAPFPPELRGTLFRLGPGTGAARRGRRVGAADAYGLAAAVTFDGGGGAVARARYVRTEAFQRDRRGLAEGSATAERNVGARFLFWADRLFALSDGCKPYLVDPKSLGTQKKTELGGLLREPGDGFDAWAAPDAGRAGRLSQCAREEGLPFLGGDAAVFRDFDAGFRTAGEAARLPLARGEAVAASTASRFVALVAGGADGALAAAVAPRGAAAAAPRAPLALPAGRRLEVAAARDDGGAVVADVVVDAGAAPAPLATRAWGELWRVRVEGAAARAERLAPAHAGLGLPCALPGGGLAFADADDGGLVAVDAAGAAAGAWAPGAGWAAGAPTAVGGLVVALLHGDGRTDVAALDAADLAAGPVARAPLPAPLPRTAFDGPFAPGLAPDLDEIRQAETLARLYARKSAEWNEVDGGFSGLGIKSFLFPKGVSGG